MASSQVMSRVEVLQEPSLYLTDGTHLFRVVPTIRGAAGDELVGLEDCASLNAHLISARELAEMQLRPVLPATSPEPGPGEGRPCLPRTTDPR